MGVSMGLGVFISLSDGAYECCGSAIPWREWPPRHGGHNPVKVPGRGPVASRVISSGRRLMLPRRSAAGLGQLLIDIDAGDAACPSRSRRPGSALEVECYAAVSCEPVEDRYRQGGYARFPGVAGRVVEGQLVLLVSGDQDQVAAGGRGFAVRAADLLVYRCHDEPAPAEFTLHPLGVEAGDDVGLKLVPVAGEVAELLVEQAPDPAVGFFHVSAVFQAAGEE